ncbi:VOC family protein [Streptomyces sp. NPDC007901]|uniref:VOC family protein n=1 Tax=Streptomyces sp. NPDC007901 TaxID=3364785 RepID=UPI0036ECDA60
MTVELNHTIVPTRDPQTSARFLAGILGLSVDPPLAHFTPVTLANQVSLDYDRMDDFEPHHYAFLLSDQEFDAALARLRRGGITHYGDPACQESGQVYHGKRTAGRRGTYFRDPDGHLMEILTPGGTGSSGR